MIRKICIAALAAVAVCSCLKEQTFHEEEPFLSPESMDLVVSSDPMTDTLLVSSNRSWTASLLDPVPWLKLSSVESLNLSGSTQENPLILEFEANMVKTDRQAAIVLTNGSQRKVVNVLQKAIVYKLDYQSLLRYDDLKESGDTVSIFFSTNGTWELSVKEGATASVSFPVASGQGDAVVEAIVGENFDTASGKDAVIVLTVPDCDPVEIQINQKKAVPYVRCEVPEKAGRYVDPSVFSSLGSTRNFNVVSNGKWTAKVSPKSTATGITISDTSGEGAKEGFTVTVKDANTDFANRKDVIIEFTPEGGVPFEYTMKQEKGSILALECWNQDVTKAVWPFDEVNPGAGNSLEGAFHIGGYAFSYYTTIGSYFDASFGWRLGATSACYFEMPAIPGHKLVRVSIIEHNGSVAPSIQTVGGAVVSGGEPFETFTKLVLLTWNLKGTENGAAYRFVLGKDKNLRVRYLELEYE